jgi:CubicO group peptidase (beta-lactamase class C family)
MSVGIIDGDRSDVFGYGRLDESVDQKPDGKTLFEIGSVSKVFTGLLLADMAQRKEIALDDTVGKFLPPSVTVPRRPDREITLLDLATHTSGLPGLPPNIVPQIVENPSNPFAAYTVEQLYEFLSTHKLEAVPGAQFAYSNLGVGLLGHTLATRAETGYEELLVDRIAGPLGMRDTRIGLSDAMRKRLAPGHDADGNLALNWDIPTLAGAGALRSTVDDMLVFLSANLGLRETDLAGAIRTTHVPRHPMGNSGGQIAMGWHLGPDELTFWHNGQTGGYHSFVAFRKDRKIGVVVLANSPGDVVDLFGMSLMSLLAGESVEPIDVRMPIDVDLAVLDEYVGNYTIAAPNFTLHVSRQGDHLMAQATNQGRCRIYPESETKFFYRMVDAQITFTRDEDGKVNGLTIHQGGIDMPGLRADEGRRP